MSTRIAAEKKYWAERHGDRQVERTVGSLLAEYHRAGRILFRDRLTSPVLVWAGVQGYLTDGDPSRDTLPIDTLTVSQLANIGELSRKVWSLRSRDEAGGPVPVRVGRSLDADVVLNDHSVSDKHCIFYVVQYPELPNRFIIRVRDLSSLNGVRVNGRRVRVGRRARVREGDRVDVGRLVLEVLSPSELFERIEAAAEGAPTS